VDLFAGAGSRELKWLPMTGRLAEGKDVNPPMLHQKEKDHR